MEDACGQKHINHVVPSSDSHCRLTTKPKFSAPNNQAVALILCFGSHHRFVGGSHVGQSLSIDLNLGATEANPKWRVVCAGKNLAQPRSQARKIAQVGPRKV